MIVFQLKQLDVMNPNRHIYPAHLHVQTAWATTTPLLWTRRSFHNKALHLKKRKKIIHFPGITELSLSPRS